MSIFKSKCKKKDEVFTRQREEAENILKDKEKTQRLVERALNICDRLSNIPRVGILFEDLPVACMMVGDYISGNYKDVPLASIVTITVAMAYIVSPINLVSNTIPVIGTIDDAVVILWALSAVHNDINSYAEWKYAFDNE